MKKILLILTALVLSQTAMAQQFSLPILPEKMWPSEYANYETDILNCCNYLLTADPAFNQPKHEECTSFLLRWLEGAPQVQLVVAPDIVDPRNEQLLLAYLAAWTRHSLQYKDSSPLVCANVAVEDMLRYYETFQSYVGKSRLCERLLKAQRNGDLAAVVAKAVMP
ncbi:MAG: hypothetical protein IK126_06150 [Bacteroidales bacterium]|nr:hypothetical protein [Bacteroidales bacterium]